MVSVIIVSYNTAQLTCNCIGSIIKYTIGVNYEIIVVDNASTDNSVSSIQSLFPQVQLIQSPQNLGFGSANNLAAQQAKGEFLFFLNPDTILIENSIKMLHDFFVDHEQNMKIGVLGCKLIAEDGSINSFGHVFPTVKNNLGGLWESFEKKVNKRWKDREWFDLKQPYFEIDQVVGADMFLKKSLFENVGRFDPQFFMYYEETDLQKRIKDLGYKNYITTGTSIIHLEGGSSESGYVTSNFSRTVSSVSRNYYFKKHDKKHYLLHVFIESILNLRRLFSRNYSLKENWAFVKANFKSY